MNLDLQSSRDRRPPLRPLDFWCCGGLVGASTQRGQLWQPLQQRRPPPVGGGAEVNRDAPSVQRQGGGGLEHLLTKPAQTPALPGLPLQQAAQAMQDLIGVEAQQQAHLVARHHVLDGGGATIRRREVHVECRLHLAHMGFGAAPLAIERQDLLRRPVERKRSTNPTCCGLS